MYQSNSVAVVVPCFQVERHIKQVVKTLPSFIDLIILVNDHSTDQTLTILKDLANDDHRIIVLNHKENYGVGGAMRTGLHEALKRKSDLIVKIDGDGQMDSGRIIELVKPLQNKKVGFSKGNRFADFKALRKMPAIRRFGNLALSFIIKVSSGYWKVMDPTNGFFCITSETLQKIDFKRLSSRYFFESSLLIELYYTGANIVDIPMSAQYNDEKSNLHIRTIVPLFSYKLFKAFVRRILYRYFIYDFSVFSIYILLGLPLLSFGVIFGLINWITHASAGVTTPTGTVMLSILPIILGFQMLLSWIQADIDSHRFFISTNNQPENENEESL